MVTTVLLDCLVGFEAATTVRPIARVCVKSGRTPPFQRKALCSLCMNFVPFFLNISHAEFRRVKRFH